eukprot:Skav229662  [mRNA]  locus=scaffold1030:107154:109679:+ [translate_table: standard]
MLVILKPRTNDYARSLFHALADDDIAAVNDILETGQDPNGWFWHAPDRSFRPFLLCAVTLRATASVGLLLDAFANPNVPTANRRGALHLAVLLGQAGMAQALLEHAADVNAGDLHGETPLHFAAWMEQDTLIPDLIATGGNPLQQDRDCDVPLVCCEEPATRAALLDGCWRKLSFCHILLLLLPALRRFLQADQLRTLCREVRRRDLFLESTQKLEFSDALGGSTVDVCSALNGEPLFCVDIDANDATSLCSLVRAAGSRLCQLPFFAIDVFCEDLHSHGSRLLDEDMTRSELGRPCQVQIVKKPKTLDWTEEIFGAVESGDVAAVKKFLQLGQDPNCILRQSILGFAVQSGSFGAVRTLLAGQACPNFIPPGSRGPLHAAVAYDQERIADLLLQHGANPDLTNGNGDSPLYLAVLYQDLPFSCRLLAAGANPLLANTDGQNAFYCAGSGLMIAVCISHSAGRILPVHWVIRHLPQIIQFCSCKHLWFACKSLLRQRRYWDALGGARLLGQVDDHSSADRSGGSAAHQKQIWIVQDKGEEKDIEAKRQKVASAIDPARTSARQLALHNRAVAAKLAELRKSGAHIAASSTKTEIDGLLRLTGCRLGRILPILLRDGYLVRSIVPATPDSWPAKPPVCVDHLRFLQPSDADVYLTFHEPSHRYCWHGKQVGLSVTQLIHLHTPPFQAEEVIARMKSGNNWPRPKYLKPDLSHTTARLKLQGLPFAQNFLEILEAKPMDAAALFAGTEEIAGGRHMNIWLAFVQSDSEIKSQWSQAAVLGASQGTWMHCAFENLLNGGYVTTIDAELRLFLAFLKSPALAGWTVYRTEWTVYAAREDVAGSIN